MFVTNDVAVLKASAGFTPGNPSDNGSDPWTRWSTYRASTDNAENASSETVYPVHRCSTSGSTPATR